MSAREPEQQRNEGVKLGVVLLNWNGALLTLRCAESLPAAADGVDHLLIVVDNGSSDNSVAFLSDALPSAILVKNGENRGFARGTNVGIRRAIEERCTHIAIINNDAILTPESLRIATEVLVTDRGIGLVGGKVLSPETGRIWFAGARINHLLARTTVVGAGEPDDGRWDEPQDVEAITLAFAIGPSEIFRVVGLIPEDYLARRSGISPYQ